MEEEKKEKTQRRLLIDTADTLDAITTTTDEIKQELEEDVPSPEEVPGPFGLHSEISYDTLPSTPNYNRTRSSASTSEDFAEQKYENDSEQHSEQQSSESNHSEQPERA